MLGNVPVYQLSPTVLQTTLKCLSRGHKRNTHMPKNPPAAPHMVPGAEKERNRGERREGKGRVRNLLTKARKNKKR